MLCMAMTMAADSIRLSSLSVPLLVGQDALLRDEYQEKAYRGEEIGEGIIAELLEALIRLGLSEQARIKLGQSLALTSVKH